MRNPEPSQSNGSGLATGGDSLTANSFAQTVVGYNNIENPSTLVVLQGAPPAFSPSNPTVESPLLIVGNGTQTTQSNAFEVTYDGHSIVHDVMGNSALAGRSPVYGGTYQDNVVSAWGDVPAGGGAPTADFGMQPGIRVANPAAGVYIVSLNPLTHAFTQASITATGEDNTPVTLGPLAAAPLCIEISCSEIGHPGPDQFIVRTYANCTPTNEAFFFKVCGR